MTDDQPLPCIVCKKQLEATLGEWRLPRFGVTVIGTLVRRSLIPSSAHSRRGSILYLHPLMFGQKNEYRFLLARVYGTCILKP